MSERATSYRLNHALSRLSYTASDLELDRLSQQVRRAGQSIELTAKEYALLEHLMLNAGRVLWRILPK